MTLGTEMALSRLFFSPPVPGFQSMAEAEWCEGSGLAGLMESE